MSEAKKKDVKCHDLDVQGEIKVGGRTWAVPSEDPGLTLEDVEELVRKVDSEWSTAVADVRVDMVALHESDVRAEGQMATVYGELERLSLRDASARPTYFQQQFGELDVAPKDRVPLDWQRVCGETAGVVDRELHVVKAGLYELRVEVSLSTSAMAFGALIAELMDNRKVQEATIVGTVPLVQNKGLPERYTMTTLAYLDDTRHLRLVVQNDSGAATFKVHGDPDLSFMSVRLVDPSE